MSLNKIYIKLQGNTWISSMNAYQRQQSVFTCDIRETISSCPFYSTKQLVFTWNFFGKIEIKTNGLIAIGSGVIAGHW